ERTRRRLIFRREWFITNATFRSLKGHDLELFIEENVVTRDGLGSIPPVPFSAAHIAPGFCSRIAPRPRWWSLDWPINRGAASSRSTAKRERRPSRVWPCVPRSPSGKPLPRG